jgi:hypothetical protein
MNGPIMKHLGYSKAHNPAQARHSRQWPTSDMADPNRHRSGNLASANHAVTHQMGAKGSESDMPDTAGKAELTVVTCIGKIHMSVQLYSPCIFRSSADPDVG